MNDNLKQLTDLLNKLVGETKNYDPRTEEGYRNIIDTLAEIRNDAKTGMWKLYELITDQSINDTLDEMYNKATEIYKEANKVVKNKATEVKETVCKKVAEVKEKIDVKIDNKVSDTVDDYLNELIGDKDITLKEYTRVKRSLVDYTNWLIKRTND